MCTPVRMQVTCAILSAFIKLTSSLIEDFIDPGNPACPCLTEQNANSNWMLDVEALLPQLTTRFGDERVYGLNRCAPYDMYHPPCQNSTAGNEPRFCHDAWCYVDPAQCAENEEACLAAGGILGGEPPQVCQRREMAPSTFSWENLTQQVYFSYATCGSTDTWTDLSERVTSRRLKVLVLEEDPWIYSASSVPGAIEVRPSTPSPPSFCNPGPYFHTSKVHSRAVGVHACLPAR